MTRHKHLRTKRNPAKLAAQLAADSQTPLAPSAPKPLEKGISNPLPLEERFEHFLREYRSDEPAIARKKALKDFYEHHKIPGKLLQPLTVADEVHSGLCDSWTMAKFKHGGQLEFTCLRQHKEGYLKVSPIHLELYELLNEQINKPHLLALQKALVALFIRSSEKVNYIMVQVEKLTPSAAKDCKILGEWLERSVPQVSGLYSIQVSSQSPWVFVDPPKVKPPELKQWYGPGLFQIDFAESKRSQMISFLDHFRPNRRLADHLVDRILSELKPRPGQKLLDLYAGCGFWGQQLASHYTQVTGVDIRRVADESANINSKRMQLKNYRFIHDSVTTETITQVVGENGEDWQAIIDPPPGNLPNSFVTVLAEKGIKRVVRFYVEADRLASEVNKWRREGYYLYKVIPLDTIPGSPRLEYMAIYLFDNIGIMDKSKKAAPKKSFGFGPAGQSDFKPATPLFKQKK